MGEEEPDRFSNGTRQVCHRGIRRDDQVQLLDRVGGGAVIGQPWREVHDGGGPGDGEELTNPGTGLQREPMDTLDGEEGGECPQAWRPTPVIGEPGVPPPDESHSRPIRDFFVEGRDGCVSGGLKIPMGKWDVGGRGLVQPREGHQGNDEVVRGQRRSSPLDPGIHPREGSEDGLEGGLGFQQDGGPLLLRERGISTKLEHIPCPLLASNEKSLTVESLALPNCGGRRNAMDVVEGWIPGAPFQLGPCGRPLAGQEETESKIPVGLRRIGMFPGCVLEHLDRRLHITEFAEDDAQVQLGVEQGRFQSEGLVMQDRRFREAILCLQNGAESIQEDGVGWEDLQAVAKDSLSRWEFSIFFEGEAQVEAK